MFSGEDSTRLKSDLAEEKIEEIIGDAFDQLGRVRFGSRGEFTVAAKRFDSALSTTQIHGRLSQSRKDGEWRLSVDYTVSPTALLWILAAVLFVFTFVGALIILLPLTTKGEVQRGMSNALRDARDDVES